MATTPGVGRHRVDGIPAEEKDASYTAKELYDKADKLLQKAHSRSREIQALAWALKRVRERNHFGEMVRSALDGRG